MTDRLLRAIENPSRRHPRPSDRPAAAEAARPTPSTSTPCSSAAARHGVALEINCQVERLDLNDVHARLARERGVRLVISSDAHSGRALGDLRWGVLVARRAWLDARPRAEHAAVRGVSRVAETPPEPPAMKLPMLTADDKLAEIKRLYFNDHAADDSGGPGQGARPAQVDGERGGARARDRLHGRPGADAARLGREEGEEREKG